MSQPTRWSPVALLLLPDLALAHSPVKGIGDFYSGMLHPLLVPSHLLLLIGLGLLLGQHGMGRHRGAFFAFLGAMFLGLTTSWFLTAGTLESVFLVGAGVLGILVATRLAVPTMYLLCAALPLGLLLGLDSAQPSLQGRQKLFTLLGSGLGATLLLLYLTGLSDFCNRRQWLSVGTRIVGSWTAAAAVLVLSLSLVSAGP